MIPEELEIIDEPLIEFGHGQCMNDPKDGLFLFGPVEESRRRPLHMRIGVVGTDDGIVRYKRWANTIVGHINAKEPEVVHHKGFPGYESAFGAKWPVTPICEIEVSKNDIDSNLLMSNRHEAIFNTVSIFEDAIRKYLREEGSPVDVWFVIIPEDIHRYGRPKSIIPVSERIQGDGRIDRKHGRKLLIQPSMLFPEDNVAAQIYRYEINFHHQLKARLLDIGAVIQIVRETSLTPEDFKINERPLRKVQDNASIAWNLCTTAYFKAGGRPWKLANVREGVCYIGLVYKMDTTNPEKGNACCGAQMFLDSGDGLVFKGAVGPWYSDSRREFHLPYDKANELITKVVNAYKQEHGKFPKELFIHGKTRFDDDEWNGFKDAVPESTNLVGVRIRNAKDVKLYSPGNMPVIRGTLLKMGKYRGFLWTRGFIPQLNTYQGREVPNPLDIQIQKGQGDLLQIMRDIMGLTKVNFNACIYADGYPVTLRFADAVGEILTAAPISSDLPPLPFRHYI